MNTSRIASCIWRKYPYETCSIDTATMNPTTIVIFRFPGAPEIDE